MAEDKLESGGRKNSYKRDRDWEMDDENEYEDDEPNFSDAEDYVDNILEDGKTSKIVVIYHARAGTSSSASLDHDWSLNRYSAASRSGSQVTLTVQLFGNFFHFHAISVKSKIPFCVFLTRVTG